MRALDLFCGAGGAGVGLQRSGMDVHGVDANPQPNYPMLNFLHADAIWAAEHLSSAFDFIWASPPCQAFTAYKRRQEHVAPALNLIPQIRDLLRASGLPYVIENVPGAPLENPFTLCGSMFGLNVRRHRIFETSFPVTVPGCQHAWQEPRFPGATNRKNLRKTVEVGVWRIPLPVQGAAMGIDWMNLKELSQAVPPAYSEFIARQWMTRKWMTR